MNDQKRQPGHSDDVTCSDPDCALCSPETYQLDQELMAQLHSAERAAEARHGGRAITDKISRRLTVLRRAADPNDGLDWKTCWTYHIDPAYSGWDSIAATDAKGYDASSRPMFLTEAEAMMSWPIYRAAIARQIEEQAYVAGAMATHANIAANDRFVRVVAAMDRTKLTGKRATPGVASTIAAIVNPTVEEIADVLYLSGSKGGKLAALGVAKDILTELEA